MPTANDIYVRNTLSYYLSSTFDLFRLINQGTQAKLTTLKNSLQSIEEKYRSLLIQTIVPNLATDSRGKPLGQKYLDYFNKQRAGKVLDEADAQTFLDKANAEMAADIDIFFAEAQIRATMFNADPIISDPRFRMSIVDPRWNEYDETIKQEVAFYNQKFAGVANFVPLDWRLVKAMMWTEVMAGPKGNPTEWQQRPMQIGVVKGGKIDPGLPALKKGSENTDLIITPEFRAKLNQVTQMDGVTNIKAGVAWLFRKAGGDQVKWNENKIDNPQIMTATVIANEKGFDGLADRLETTIKNIEINNPDIDPRKLQAGQEIKYQKAHRERYISGWLDWRTAIKNYNSKAGSGEGDEKYLLKFDNAYQIIISRDR